MSKILFQLTAVATTAFIVTILALVSMLLGNPKAPANVWFDQHGAVVMTVEVLTIGILGFAAMFVDRLETLRLQQAKSDDTSESQPEIENRV